MTERDIADGDPWRRDGLAGLRRGRLSCTACSRSPLTHGQDPRLPPHAGENVFTCDSGGGVWLRPSGIGAVALAIPTAPDWRVSPNLHVIPGTTRWAVTAAGRS
jgi:hypothetical protein